MEQSSAPQETSINDLFVPDVAPVTQAVAPSNAPVEQVPAQVTPVVEAPKPAPTVPLPELLEQRHARQLAEQKAEFLAQQLAMFQRSAEAQRPLPQPIDPELDPRGAHQAVIQTVHEQALHQRANTSEMLARDKFGDEAVDKAVAWAVQSGRNREFMSKPNPYRALMNDYNAQQIAQQVGPDLKAWETKKEQEIEARILARLSAGKPNAAPQNLPPSLSNATNANNSVPVVKESSDFFKEMFAKPRT